MGSHFHPWRRLASLSCFLGLGLWMLSLAIEPGVLRVLAAFVLAVVGGLVVATSGYFVGDVGNPIPWIWLHSLWILALLFLLANMVPFLTTMSYAVMSVTILVVGRPWVRWLCKVLPLGGPPSGSESIGNR